MARTQATGGARSSIVASIPVNPARPSRPASSLAADSWDTVDWDAEPDWEWHSAAADTPAQLLALWQDAVARSRSLVDRKSTRLNSSH